MSAALTYVFMRSFYAYGWCRCDFESRFFGPRCGVDEDPVTGSAHCCLEPYWRGRYEAAGKPVPEWFTAVQASARRGELRVRCVGDTSNDAGRIELRGTAVLTVQGHLVAQRLPAE